MSRILFIFFQFITFSHLDARVLSTTDNKGKGKGKGGPPPLPKTEGKKGPPPPPKTLLLKIKTRTPSEDSQESQYQFGVNISARTNAINFNDLTWVKDLSAGGQGSTAVYKRNDNGEEITIKHLRDNSDFLREVSGLQRASDVNSEFKSSRVSGRSLQYLDYDIETRRVAVKIETGRPIDLAKWMKKLSPHAADQTNASPSISVLKNIFRQMIEGLFRFQYQPSRNNHGHFEKRTKNILAHLDVKPSNFLMNQDTNEIVVIDFGTATIYDVDVPHIEAENNHKGTGLFHWDAGSTRGFDADKLMQTNPKTGAVDKYFSAKTDTYALGKTLEMISLGFSDENVFSGLLTEKKGQAFIEKLWDEKESQKQTDWLNLHDLIKNLASLENKFTLEDALAHEFFQRKSNSGFSDEEDNISTIYASGDEEDNISASADSFYVNSENGTGRTSIASIPSEEDETI